MSLPRLDPPPAAAYTPPSESPPRPAPPQTHGCPIGDPARLRALYATGVLQAPCGVALDRLARFAEGLLGAPFVLVSLVDVDRQCFVGSAGLGEVSIDVRETPLSHSFCRHVVASGERFVVDDARRHPLVCDNPAIQAFGVVAYAGVPIVTTEGQVLGSFCAIDTVPRAWGDAELGVLGELAATAAALLTFGQSARDAAARAAELQAVLDVTEELVCTTDAAGRITWANAAWQRALGYEAAELGALDPVRLVASADQARYRAAARELVEGASVHSFEATLVGKHGQRVVCRGWAVPRFAPGAGGRPVVVGAVAGYHDVTAEREVEAARGGR